MRETLVAVVAFAVLFTLPGFARDTARGYAQAVETAVAKGHPSLFADADAFAALRASVGDGTLRGGRLFASIGPYSVAERENLQMQVLR